jgi:hypothetical protein
MGPFQRAGISGVQQVWWVQCLPVPRGTGVSLGRKGTIQQFLRRREKIIVLTNGKKANSTSFKTVV